MVLVTSTCPPCAAAFTRAHRLIGAWSTWSLPAARASPVCSPIRTRSAAPAGHASAVSRSWQAPAASTAATALGNTAKKLSPSPREVTTTPP